MADYISSGAPTIQEDGLRFKVKPSGAPFSTNIASGNISCLLCGQHIPRTEGAFKKLFNARQFVCFKCRPIKPVTNDL